VETSIQSQPARGRTVLVVSQTFVPDPAAVGQYMAEVAFRLVGRGHAVRVYASGRGYEDAGQVYPRRETLHGVDVRRLPLASFGKRSILLRVIGTAVFHAQAFLAALTTPQLAGIFFSTSPPLIGLPLCLVGWVRRIPVAYWAMDLNPDQLIALGKLKPRSVRARLLEAANRFILRRSSLVVALDRFMSDRLTARGVPASKLLVLPPWPHEEHIRPTGDDGPNPFRARHGLEGKFVVMYSGNHSPSNPLTTLLAAAVRLRDDDSLRFLFVGGGHGKREVEATLGEHQLTNTLSLPYQPLADLRHSLSAADVHAVSLGEGMVGIIHPCKIYGAMAVGTPILFLGPRPSHITDLLDAHDLGLHVAHGDVDGMVAAIRQLRSMSPDRRRAVADAGRSVLDGSLGQQQLSDHLCDAIERNLRLRPV
jgi:glycosyltransferase involved in cell wall biosynthesis